MKSPFLAKAQRRKGAAPIPQLQSDGFLFISGGHGVTT